MDWQRIGVAATFFIGAVVQGLDTTVRVGLGILAALVLTWPYLKQVWERCWRARRRTEVMAQLAAQGPINGPGFAIYHPPRAPDFWKWDDRQVFTLGQVAALWLNQEPENLPLRAPVSEVFWRLYGDIYAGRLKPKLNIDELLSRIGPGRRLPNVGRRPDHR